MSTYSTFTFLWVSLYLDRFLGVIIWGKGIVLVSNLDTYLFGVREYYIEMTMLDCMYFISFEHPMVFRKRWSKRSRRRDDTKKDKSYINSSTLINLLRSLPVTGSPFVPKFGIARSLWMTHLHSRMTHLPHLLLKLYYFRQGDLS